MFLIRTNLCLRYMCTSDACWASKSDPTEEGNYPYRLSVVHIIPLLCRGEESEYGLRRIG